MHRATSTTPVGSSTESSAHIESIRVGAHPAPGHSPFLLSYFWGLQDEAAWPTIWASAAAFTEFCTGQPLPSVPSDRYAAFVEFAGEVDDDFERFIRVASWFEKAKPVLLDPVLVDRCEFGTRRHDLSPKRSAHNADALVAVAQHIGDDAGRRGVGQRQPDGRCHPSAGRHLDGSIGRGPTSGRLARSRRRASEFGCG